MGAAGLLTIGGSAGVGRGTLERVLRVAPGQFTAFLIHNKLVSSMVQSAVYEAIILTPRRACAQCPRALRRWL